ncbi:uncharacterized protein TRUGW13939_03802 [Talaromyces rugulosus]|uniref:Sigma-70 region 2 family protein n=1 Tax=Talaromyces rugulosus TaxID=121627 RepID=A0A7H8QS76_TALRU|nr:uncharacterized protein TRUGW13939_03802 [Talaromyces rugulosus]QKX56696.1 hypothetical protein TRUGW13939_03802 [Talaromyces rugulosus]
MSSTPSQPANPPPIRWQFIDSSNDNGDNLTQVKRHVMQEFMRQKRETQQQDTSSDDNTGDDQAALKKKKKKANNAKKRQRAAQKTQKNKASSAENPKSNKRLSDTSKRGGETEVAARSPGQFIAIQPDQLLVSRPKASLWDFNNSPSDCSDFFDEAVAAYNSPTLSAWSRTEASSPQTLLSAARTDPFDTMPLQLTTQDQHLFDFYVHEMPSCSYGDHFRTRSAHNWYTEVFVPEAMKGPLTFVNTVLVHAANTQAWLRNQTETAETLFYRQRAITMLTEHMLKYPHDISDNAITACMSAAALEDFDPRPERKEISWIHMRQARKMIRKRGGPAAFENTKLAMLINWQDYILAGYETEEGSGSFHFESDLVSPVTNGSLMPSLPSPPCSVSSPTIDCTSSVNSARLTNTSSEPEIKFQCEEFLNFLSRCEHLAVSQKSTLPATAAPYRHTVFQPTSFLGQILASPNAKRMTASGDRKQFIARLASVMTLNAALWDYRSSVQRAEAFLDHIVSKVLDSEVNMSSSVEALLQILLSCQDFPTDISGNPFSFNSLGLWQDDLELPDYSQYSPSAMSPSARPWFIGRMLKVAKRLSLDSWVRVNEFLFSCLTLQTNEPSLHLWENDLRHEILQAPLTSYTMPALK